jgi:hypothetical protein
VTAQEQIAKLESLLERIRRNAERPRPVRAASVRAEPVAHAQPVVPAAPAPPPKPAAVAVPVVTEDVSLDSLGATETKAPTRGEPVRERVQSADMEDLEIVEIGSDITELAQVDEPVPESAPRPAVQSVEVELEPPIKTPPPESGRQAVTPPPAMADTERGAGDDDFDDDDLLETDHSGAPISITSPGAPSMAQLGDTVQIKGASEPPEDLELAVPTASAAELESIEPHRQVPAEQRDAPSGRRVDPLAATVPDMRTALSLAQTVPDAKSPFAEAIRATTDAKVEAPEVSKPASKAAAPAPSAPELVVERPPSAAAHAAEVVVAKPRKVPETFLELLEASLELRA